jgi:hypothetical protein
MQWEVSNQHFARQLFLKEGEILGVYKLDRVYAQVLKET